ncbi:MAG: hypothetical protein D6769_03640 [Methanobacteriota archaeon]|nr:MAG: hypothetical protein D6769_03640 [Euryarchaeota archaeon]
MENANGVKTLGKHAPSAPLLFFLLLAIVGAVGAGAAQSSGVLESYPSYPLITDTGGAIKANIFLNCSNESIIVESSGDGIAVLMYANLIIDRVDGNLSHKKLSFYGKLPYITEPFSLRIDWSNGSSRIVEFSLDKCKEENISAAYLTKEIVKENTTQQKIEKKEENITEKVEIKRNANESKSKVPEKKEKKSEQDICASAILLLAAMGLARG